MRSAAMWGLLGALVLPPGAAGAGGADPEPGVDFEAALSLRRADGAEAGRFAAGEPIVLVLVVRNRASEPRTLELRSSQRHDFAVSTDGGDEIWRWSKRRAFAQVITELRFAPGESKRFQVRWDQRRDDGHACAPGRYRVTARLPTTRRGVVSGSVSAAVELEIR